MASDPPLLPVSDGAEDDQIAVTVEPEADVPGDVPNPGETPSDPMHGDSPLVVDSTPQDSDHPEDLNNDDDDDDLTIIGLDPSSDPRGDQTAAALAWIEQNGPEMEERRRNVLLRELQRVQRASFIHFVLLCLIPTSLLFVVLATVLGDKEDCSSDVTLCVEEERTFINAFTTRCICDAIDVSKK